MPSLFLRNLASDTNQNIKDHEIIDNAVPRTLDTIIRCHRKNRKRLHYVSMKVFLEFPKLETSLHINFIYFFPFDVIYVTQFLKSKREDLRKILRLSFCYFSWMTMVLQFSFVAVRLIFRIRATLLSSLISCSKTHNFDWIDLFFYKFFVHL